MMKSLLLKRMLLGLVIGLSCLTGGAATGLAAVPGEESEHTDRTAVGRYVFQWNDEDDLCVVLGLGSLINHGLPENVALVSNFEEMAMEFYAIADIKAGDELVYDYGHEAEELVVYYGIPGAAAQ